MPKIIDKRPNILGGTAVIRGTRIPVARILALIALDYNLSDIKKEYPQLNKLTKGDLREILAYYNSRINYI